MKNTVCITKHVSKMQNRCSFTSRHGPKRDLYHSENISLLPPFSLVFFTRAFSSFMHLRSSSRDKLHTCGRRLTALYNFLRCHSNRRCVIDRCSGWSPKYKYKKIYIYVYIHMHTSAYIYIYTRISKMYTIF